MAVVMALALLRLGHKKDSCCPALSPSPSPSLSRVLSHSLGEARRHVVRILKPPMGKAPIRRNRSLPPTASLNSPAMYVPPLEADPPARLSLQMTPTPANIRWELK